MVQPQLVEYIVSQMKSGVSRDTISAALVGVGWQAADVQDSLTKAESDMKPAATSATAPATTSPASSPVAAKPMGVSPVSTSAGAGSPVARPSSMSNMPSGLSASRPSGTGSFSPMDIVGSGSPTVSAKPSMSQPVGASPAGMGMASKASQIFPSSVSRQTTAPVASMGTMTARPAHHVDGEKVGMIAEAIGLVALAALSIYFYTENHTLSMQLSAAGPAAASAGSSAAQVSQLQGQVQTLTASQSSLQSQTQAQSQQIADLTTQLMFFAVPPNVTPGSQASGTISGTLTVSASARGIYGLRTQYGAVIFINNSNDPKAIAALKPLVNQNVTLAGSFIPGSDGMTVVSVNGTPINAPVAPTSTATTTKTTASSTGQ